MLGSCCSGELQRDPSVLVLLEIKTPPNLIKKEREKEKKKGRKASGA